ncbi:MAG: flagellin, partial [Oscillospiraceae bacterium]|nr:flagellin [Oscillospiraceae bacterium]
DMNASARGLGTDQLSVKSAEEANYAIDQIDNAINKTNMIRATFGAVQNRLEHKINTLDTNNENLTAAESRIRDTQMDKEMMKFTSSQILSQASQSMLAQANSLPQGVLQLLG